MEPTGKTAVGKSAKPERFDVVYFVNRESAKFYESYPPSQGLGASGDEFPRSAAENEIALFRVCVR